VEVLEVVATADMPEEGGPAHNLLDSVGDVGHITVHRKGLGVSDCDVRGEFSRPHAGDDHLR